jgi:hypothetical protein
MIAHGFDGLICHVGSPMSDPQSRYPGSVRRSEQHR